MEIKLLTLTQVNWQTYIQSVENVRGKNPLLNLKGTAIQAGSPASYVSTLNDDPDVLENLRKGFTQNTAFHHYFISYIVVDLPTYLYSELLDVVDLHIFTLGTCSDKNTRTIIISGTLKSWVSSVFGLCNHHRQEFITIGNECLDQLELLGFKEIWSKYLKVKSTTLKGYRLSND